MTTRCLIHRQLVVLKSEVESKVALEWFDNNQMQANPGKCSCRAIATGSKTHSELKSFNVSGNAIACEMTVKLLSVELDYQLNFNEHVYRICQKVA